MKSKRGNLLTRNISGYPVSGDSFFHASTKLSFSSARVFWGLACDIKELLSVIFWCIYTHFIYIKKIFVLVMKLFFAWLMDKHFHRSVYSKRQNSATV